MVIRWFDEIGHDDIPLAGGKGANLGEMTQAGFPVPPGFCVTAAAYWQHMAAVNLEQALLQRVAEGDLAGVEEAAGQIRSRIEQAPMPDAVAEAIRQAYERLARQGHVRVAIRSSATAEDLPEASFAGQQETFLGITGLDEVLHHVRKAWASLWTGRAVAYRNRQGFAHDQVALAVVVQAMVEPETAGVLFTVDPMGSLRDSMLINAAYGLGESVVSGRVTPDTYRLTRTPDLQVQHRQLGAKELRIRSDAGSGSIVEEVSEAERTRFCLADNALRQLAALALQVEAHYGAPQDIEWAMAGGKLYLLQARPITTLGRGTDPAVPPRKRGKLEQVLVDSLLEHCPQPPYPLDVAALHNLIDAKGQALRGLGISAGAGTDLLKINGEGLCSIGRLSPRPNWRLLALPFKVAAWLRNDPPVWAERYEPWFCEQVAALKQADMAVLSDHQVSEQLRQALGLATELGRIRFREYVFPMALMGRLLKWSIAGLPGMSEVAEFDLLGDLPYRTAVIDEALHQLAATASSDDATRQALQLPYASMRSVAAPAFVEALDEFLRQHGARTVMAYLPFSNRSWGEDPGALVATVAAMVRSGPAGFGKRQEGSERYRQLRRRIEAGLSGPKRRRFLRLLERFREAHIGREATLYGIEAAYVEARRAVREAAGRLTERGALPAVADVLCLTIPELLAALAGDESAETVREAVRRRRRSRPRVTAAWLAEFAAALPPAEGADLLTGLSGSPGVATGPVRVIHGTAEFGRLQPGDVLVCAYTDPVWTPLFTLAAAVVSDTGGPLSHAAIVAREYGIPAVLGTQTATLKLKDGDQVQVDGNQGVVRVL